MSAESATTMDSSAEDDKYTTRPRYWKHTSFAVALIDRKSNSEIRLDDFSEVSEIWGQRRRLWRRNGEPEELETTTEALSEEDYPEVLTTRMQASAEESEKTTHPSERLQRRRRQYV